MSAAVAAFALGCGLAALFYALVGLAAVALAPALILVAALDPGQGRPDARPKPFV